jgi:hypothetical protein
MGNSQVMNPNFSTWRSIFDAGFDGAIHDAEMFLTFETMLKRRIGKK